MTDLKTFMAEFNHSERKAITANQSCVSALQGIQNTYAHHLRPGVAFDDLLPDLRDQARKTIEGWIANPDVIPADAPLKREEIADLAKARSAEFDAHSDHLAKRQAVAESLGVDHVVGENYHNREASEKLRISKKINGINEKILIPRKDMTLEGLKRHGVFEKFGIAVPETIDIEVVAKTVTTAGAAETAITERTIEAQKALFANPDSRKVLMAAYDAELIEDNKKWGWFTNAVKDSKTVPELMIDRMASPETFVEALQGKGDSHGLNRMIKQAKALATIEGKPLAETMADRLRVAGLTEFQIDVFSKLAGAYERGEQANALAALDKEFGEAAKLLRAERQAALAADLEASRAGETLVERGKGTARAGETAASDASKAANAAEKTWGAFMHENRLAFGIGAAVVVGAIGLGLWASRAKVEQGERQQAGAQRLP